MKLKVTWKLPYWRSISYVSIQKSPYIISLLLLLFSLVSFPNRCCSNFASVMLLPVLTDSHGSVTSQSLFTLNISCFPKKVKCSLRLGPPMAKLRLRQLYSQACQTSILLADSGRPILCRVLIVCNRLWSLPLSPTVSKRAGACECKKEYLRLFPFTLPELQRRDSLSHGCIALYIGSPFLKLSSILPVHSLLSFNSLYWLSLLLSNSLHVIACSTFSGTHTVLVPTALLVFDSSFLLDKSCAAGHKKLKT